MEGLSNTLGEGVMGEARPPAGLGRTVWSSLTESFDIGMWGCGLQWTRRPALLSLSGSLRDPAAGETGAGVVDPEGNDGLGSGEMGSTIGL